MSANRRMKSSLSAVWSVGGGGARVVHQMVVVVGLLRGAPPVWHAVRHCRRGLLELRPVPAEAELIVHHSITTDISEMRRLVVVGRRRGPLVRLLVVRVEVFVVEALQLVGDGGVVMRVMVRRGRGRRWRDGAGGARRHAHAACRGGVVAIAVVARGRVSRRAVHLHVLAQRRRMRVRLVAAMHTAVVRFV